MDLLAARHFPAPVRAGMVRRHRSAQESEMSTIDAIRVRATAQPASTGLRIAGLVVPYLLAAYIAYILLWYLPFKFYPDSQLFQTIQDAVGVPGFEPYFRYFTGGVEAVAVLLLLIPGLQVAGA